MSASAMAVRHEPEVLAALGSPLDRPLFITTFRSTKDTEKREYPAITLREVHAATRARVRDKKASLTLLKLQRFGDHRKKSALRNNENVRHIDGIELDYDGEVVTPEQARDMLRAADLAAVVTTSPSHTDAAPRWRAFLPTSKPLQPEERHPLVSLANGALGGILSAESWTLSQPHYFGGVAGNTAHRAFLVEGRYIDHAIDLTFNAVGKPKKAKAERPATALEIEAGPPPVIEAEPGETAYGVAALWAKCADICAAPDGAKHITINRAAFSIGGLVDTDDIHKDHALNCLLAAVATLKPRCDDFEAALDTVMTAFQDGVAEPHTPEPRAARDFYEGEDDAPAAPGALPDLTVTAAIAKPTHDRHGKRRKLHRVRFDDVQPVLTGNGSLVKGLLDTGAMSVVYGPSNVGKSFWTLDLCFHIATGRAWRGHLIKKPGAIVYVAAEGGQGFCNRVAAIRQHMATAGGQSVPLEIIPCPVDLTREGADVPELLDHIAEAGEAAGLPVAMVVIDTLSRAMQGADENQAPDMTAFVGNIDRIRAAAPAPHVLVVHHTGKDAAKGSRGHSSLRAATDTEIELVRKGEGADKSAVAVVRKQRDMAGEDVFPFTLTQVELGQDDDGAPVTSAVIAHLDDLPGAAGAPDAAKAPKPKDGAEQAFDVLAELLRTEGVTKSLKGIPKGERAVPLATWRDAVFDAGIVGDPDDAPSSRRSRWERLTVKLRGTERVRVAGDYVWMPGQDLDSLIWAAG